MSDQSQQNDAFAAGAAPMPVELEAQRPAPEAPPSPPEVVEQAASVQPPAEGQAPESAPPAEAQPPAPKQPPRNWDELKAWIREELHLFALGHSPESREELNP